MKFQEVGDYQPQYFTATPGCGPSDQSIFGKNILLQKLSPEDLKMVAKNGHTAKPHLTP